MRLCEPQRQRLRSSAARTSCSVGEGFCFSSAAALLMQNSRPSETEVRAALDRNLCRCGSHNRMVRAVLRAAQEMAAP